ncbi:MAG: hypothetical protein HGGPFJEG_01519 [Ignavibacteria bacterium]|nr:hypothetical protein [Ignavibacteria bacterium]
MKNLSGLIFVSAIILFTCSIASGQSSKMLEAFTKSYEYEANADYVNAISVMESVYEQDSYELNIRLGWLSYKAGDYQKSLDYYGKSINLMPYSIEPKLGYNLPASALKNWDDVASKYKSILEIDPQNTFVLYQLGNIYYERKDFANAYANFEKVVNLYPFDFDSVLMFAWTNYQMGKLREAKVLFGKALLISPSNQSANEGMNLVK